LFSGILLFYEQSLNRDKFLIFNKQNRSKHKVHTGGGVKWQFNIFSWQKASCTVGNKKAASVLLNNDCLSWRKNLNKERVNQPFSPSNMKK